MDGYTPEQSRKLRALELAVSFNETCASAFGRPTEASAAQVVSDAKEFDAFLRN